MVQVQVQVQVQVETSQALDQPLVQEMTQTELEQADLSTEKYPSQYLSAGSHHSRVPQLQLLVTASCRYGLLTQAAAQQQLKKDLGRLRALGVERNSLTHCVAARIGLTVDQDQYQGWPLAPVLLNNWESEEGMQ
jgi:hypothetical protein